MNLYHSHLLVKAKISNPPKQEEILSKWLRELVSDIGMKVLLGPYSIYLDTIGNRGITGIVVIETSHCSLHIWDEQSPAIMQMDVYSCADFKTETVIKKIMEFGLIDYQKMRIDRNGEFKIME